MYITGAGKQFMVLFGMTGTFATTIHRFSWCSQGSNSGNNRWQWHGRRCQNDLNQCGWCICDLQCFEFFSATCVFALWAWQKLLLAFCDIFSPSKDIQNKGLSSISDQVPDNKSSLVTDNQFCFDAELPLFLDVVSNKQPAAMGASV